VLSHSVPLQFDTLASWRLSTSRRAACSTDQPASLRTSASIEGRGEDVPDERPALRLERQHDPEAADEPEDGFDHGRGPQGNFDPGRETLERFSFSVHSGEVEHPAC
jgi:hypothetical protein